MESAPQREVTCPYCGHNAELIDSVRVYRQSYGLIWICQPCQAWVGVHKDSKTHKPKGTLAKRELRALRIETHHHFDPIWKKRAAQGMSRNKARNGLYHELAVALQIDDSECHIGMFDERLCREAIKVCRTWQEAATEAAASEDRPDGPTSS